MKSFPRLLLLCCVALASSSCTFERLTAKWQDTGIKGPWAAPGIQAQKFEREYWTFMAGAVSTDAVWRTPKGRHDARDIVSSVDKYLMHLGYFDRWPQSQAGINGYIQRVAPFTFHVVALDPTIVIMVPHDFGSLTNRSINEIMGSAPSDSGSDHMLNPITFGTKPPYHADVLWFSPDISQPPTRLTRRSDSEQELVAKRARIIVTRDGNQWITRRE